jgi:hypothetical protein
LLHAQTNKKAYANATGDVGSKRQVNKRKNKKSSREQKKRRTDNCDDEEAMEGSVRFDEPNKGTLDKSGLKEEAVLPETIPYVSFFVRIKT